MKIALAAAALARTVTVAEFDAPYPPQDFATGVIHSVLRADGTAEVVSTEPLTLRFATYDHDFAVPATQSCGTLGRLVGHRLGLPAATGTNSYVQTTTVRVRDYSATLPATTA